MSTHKHGATLAEQWQSYEKGVLPATASDVQRRETRRGTQEDEDLMGRIDAELQQFVSDIRAGKA